jgi:hypothetical protein
MNLSVILCLSNNLKIDFELLAKGERLPTAGVLSIAEAHLLL